jgi:hypothetical protein
MSSAVKITLTGERNQTPKEAGFPEQPLFSLVFMNQSRQLGTIVFGEEL